MSKEQAKIPDIPTYVVDAIIPGMGFFGATPENCLKIEIGQSIDLIEISIEAPSQEILNIGEISFEGLNCEWLPRALISAKFEMSTIYGELSDKECLENFLDGRLLHTKSENRPFLRIQFNAHHFVQRIHIKNRNDAYGSRSRYLVVRSFLGGQPIGVYKNFDIEAATRKAAYLLAKLDILTRPIQSKQDLLGTVATFRKEVIKRIESNTLKLSTDELCELLPFNKPNEAPRKYVLCICAHILLLELNNKDSINTRFLRKFSPLLSNDLLINQLTEETEHLLKTRGEGQAKITISRHEIHEARLIKKKNLFLQGMDKVINSLSKGGITAMLGYGTLLGAVRERSFMAHDDDVDLIYFDGSKSKDEVESKKPHIIELLAASGIMAWDSGYGHLHTAVDEGVGVDLFPIWEEEGQAFLAMEQLKIRGTPFNTLIPPSTVKLYDREFPAPANPEAFLADRYGEGWLYPDPYYEWPWPIDRIVTRIAEEVRAALERRARVPRRHWGRICRVAWGQRIKLGESSPPMNSLSTISVARQTGFDAVEIDVRVSSDGVPVLAHDDHLVGPDGDILITRSQVDAIKRFRLGNFAEADVYIPTLEDALKHAKGMDVQIDARISPDQVPLLRQAAERARFDPTRLQFCVYDIQQARALLIHFPESVLMWKSYQPFLDIDDYFLDEAKALGLDGVMLSLPPADKDYSEFMNKLRKRGLRVLFFIHSGDDNVLRKMISSGVDYVTTLANDSPVFRALDVGGESQ